MLDLRLKAWWWCAGIVMLSVILVLCLMPLSLQRTPLFSFEDKVIHALIFFVLMTWFAGLVSRNYLARVFLALLFYGAMIEILQGMTGKRSAEWLDFAADAFGLWVGLKLAHAGLGNWCQQAEVRLGIANGP
jgi:hypothetical protein